MRYIAYLHPLPSLSAYLRKSHPFDVTSYQQEHQVELSIKMVGIVNVYHG